jgi:ElaB/YqjD/DUF883 family membrane-anchored ribosome-binding protein
MSGPVDDDEAARIFRQTQAEVIADVEHVEQDLQALFKESADSMRVDLQQADNMNGAQIRGAIDKGFEKTVFRRRRVIAQVIESSAPKGSKAVRKTFRVKFGEDTTKAQLRTSKAALNEGANRIAGRTTVDHVSLSKRIRKWDTRIGADMAREIERGLKSKKGIEQIAKRIVKLDNVTEGLPKYLQEIESLARAGSPELKRVAKQYLKRAQAGLGTMTDGVRKASPYSIRSPTQKFLRDIQKAGTDGVDAVVKEYVEKRAAWRANVIARHESLSALDRGYIENARKKPAVYAFHWRLSGAHPTSDECDCYAAANDYGLGPGRYPAEKLPKRHPGCICGIVACVDERHFERTEGGVTARQEYADKKSPTGIEWLKRNPDRAAAILGPTRHELLQRGVNVLDAEGKPRLVRDLLGGHLNAAE